MPGTSSITDPQSAVRLAYAQGAVNRAPSNADFSAAMSQAASTSSPSTDAAPTAIPPRIATPHVVKPGETLYGIAKARLAAAGQPEASGASMRYALRIAQSNGIRDPNRIYAGQSLDLPTNTAAAPARSDRALSIAGTHSLPGSTPSTISRTALWESRIVDDVRPDDADPIAFDIAAADTDTATEPDAAAATAAAEPVARDETHAAQQTAAANRIALARYTETAATTVTDRAAPAPATATTAAATEQTPDILYKGLVGKLLDALPIDASARTGLQQANAIIGSSFAGRSLAALTGIGGPLLTLAGLAWGLFSAQKIGAAQSDVPPPASPPRPELTAARE